MSKAQGGNMTDPKDIVIKVSDIRGQELSIIVAWDATYDEWKPIFRTILTFLEFGIEDGEYERNY